jgi:AcrR family transcriptional regulator
VLVSQRARLLEATVEVVGANGYAGSSVGDIIKAARVSRTTFYEQFRDREDCFIAAYEDRAERHFEDVVASTKQITGSMARLQAGVRAYLGALASQPALARMLLVDVLAAGPAAAASRDSLHARYAALLRKWHDEARSEYADVPQMPEEIFACAVGGVADAAAARLRSRGAEQLPALAPVIVTYLLNVAAVPVGRELAAALAAARASRP